MTSMPSKSGFESRQQNGRNLLGSWSLTPKFGREWVFDTCRSICTTLRVTTHNSPPLTLTLTLTLTLHYTMGRYLLIKLTRTLFPLHGGSLSPHYTYTDIISTTRWVVISSLNLHGHHFHYTVGSYLLIILTRTSCSLHGGSLSPHYTYTDIMFTTRWVVISSALFVYGHHFHYTVACYFAIFIYEQQFTTRWVVTSAYIYTNIVFMWYINNHKEGPMREHLCTQYTLGI